MKLNTFNRYSLAIELLSLDARISIVAEQTGLSPEILRKITFWKCIIDLPRGVP